MVSRAMARRSRQAAATMRSTSSSSSSPTGASWRRRRLPRSTSSASLSPSMTASRDSSPCCMALSATTALPCGVFGPVLLVALWRLASIWRWLVMVRYSSTCIKTGRHGALQRQNLWSCDQRRLGRSHVHRNRQQNTISARKYHLRNLHLFCWVQVWKDQRWWFGIVIYHMERGSIT